MTWIFFVINKGTCIDYMEGLQVSGTYSEEWCEHLAWRENTFSRDLIANLVGHLVENDMDTLHEERIHLVGTNYIGYIDWVKLLLAIAFYLVFWMYGANFKKI